MARVGDFGPPPWGVASVASRGFPDRVVGLRTDLLVPLTSSAIPRTTPSTPFGWLASLLGRCPSLLSGRRLPAEVWPLWLGLVRPAKWQRPPGADVR